MGDHPKWQLSFRGREEKLINKVEVNAKNSQEMDFSKNNHRHKVTKEENNKR